MKTTRAANGTTGMVGLEITGIEKVTREVSEVGMGAILVLAALIGIWGFACLMGGIVNGGGITELANGWMSAVAGR